MAWAMSTNRTGQPRTLSAAFRNSGPERLAYAAAPAVHMNSKQNGAMRRGKRPQRRTATSRATELNSKVCMCFEEHTMSATGKGRGTARIAHLKWFSNTRGLAAGWPSGRKIQQLLIGELVRRPAGLSGEVRFGCPALQQENAGRMLAPAGAPRNLPGASNPGLRTETEDQHHPPGGVPGKRLLPRSEGAATQGRAALGLLRVQRRDIL